MSKLKVVYPEPEPDPNMRVEFVSADDLCEANLQYLVKHQVPLEREGKDYVWKIRRNPR